MLANRLLFIFILSLFGLSLNARLLSQEKIEGHFASVNEEIKNRWNGFQADREFKLFEMDRSDDQLSQEFEELKKIRKWIWTTPGYELGEHLIRDDFVRAPHCLSFAFNNTVPNYNASTMYQGGKNYIACEGPRSKDISNFFKLLVSHRVTHLVRLTDSFEGETKKCHPYWEGHSSDGWLRVPTETGVYPIRSFDMAYWKDNEGVDPKQLLAVVLKVREELKEGLLLVHCSAGVGRTGTFLASIAIVDAIDQGEPFSIEEIVYRLSLQRPHSVAKLGQYITLYRLAELYLKERS